jgi:single-strand DNA-binding protein
VETPRQRPPVTDQPSPHCRWPRNGRGKNSEGAWESRTEWHRCVSFGKLADFAATLKKGAHVQVEGELRGREYEKDGVKHKVFECRVESILKLDRAERRGENELEDRES